VAAAVREGRAWGKHRTEVTEATEGVRRLGGERVGWTLRLPDDRVVSRVFLPIVLVLVVVVVLDFFGGQFQYSTTPVS
jgi:hypothetical protein